MPYVKARSKRDRREADLLLNVVLAHMAFHSAKDLRTRRSERQRFTTAVQIFHDFVMATNAEAGALDLARSS